MFISVEMHPYMTCIRYKFDLKFNGGYWYCCYKCLQKYREECGQGNYKFIAKQWVDQEGKLLPMYRTTSG